MVERPTRLETLVRIAEAISERGTCSRLQVGAVIHREGRVLSTGYNGAPAGVEHCNHREFTFTEEVQEWPSWVIDFFNNAGSEMRGSILTGTKLYADGNQVVFRSGDISAPTCSISCHAERNAIDWAARHGVTLLGSELVTTDTPCLSCAGSIINAGICAVWSVRPYRDESGVKLLRSGKVEHHMVGDYLGKASFPRSRH